mmetsp:Transcript_8374/g.27930  ORF Transcript_8374/g.27930 Transcript_8374/m.27930 type:complete len:300 (+) Transcript_8374:683-1582(+)
MLGNGRQTWHHLGLGFRVPGFRVLPFVQYVRYPNHCTRNNGAAVTKHRHKKTAVAHTRFFFRFVFFSAAKRFATGTALAGQTTPTAGKTFVTKSCNRSKPFKTPLLLVKHPSAKKSAAAFRADAVSNVNSQNPKKLKNENTLSVYPALWNADAGFIVNKTAADRAASGSCSTTVPSFCKSTTAHTCAAFDRKSALDAAAHLLGDAFQCSPSNAESPETICVIVPTTHVPIVATARISNGQPGKNACVCSCSYPTSAMRRKYTASQVTRPCTAAQVFVNGALFSVLTANPSSGNKRPDVS